MVDYLFFIGLARYSLRFSGELRNGCGSTHELDMAREEATFSKSSTPNKRKFYLFEIRGSNSKQTKCYAKLINPVTVRVNQSMNYENRESGIVYKRHF